MVGPKTKMSPDPKRGTKSPTRTKSPARTKSPVRSKSPGVSKSPGRPASPGRRSPGRPPSKKGLVKSGSPARTKVGTDVITSKASPELIVGITKSRRSPIRRSPERAVRAIKEDKQKDVQVVVSVSRTSTRKQKKIIDLDTDSDTGFDEQPLVKEKPKATVRGRTRLDVELDQVELQKDNDIGTELSSSSLIRRVTRSQNREFERIVHLKHFDTFTKKMGEFSDEDEIVTKDSTALKKITDSNLPYEFGGTFGALFFTVFLPVSAVLLYVFCTEMYCSFTQFPKDLGRFKSVGAFFDLKSSLVYLGYLLLLSVLSALPFGGKKVSGLPNKHEKLTYVANGLFCAAIITFIVISLEIKDVPATDFIIEHLFHFLIAAITVGLVLSVFAYVRSFYVPVSALNTYAVGKSAVYNFFMGRELNPRLFGILDLKMFAFRMCLIGTLLIDFAYLYKSLGLTFQPKANQTESLIENFKYINLQPTVLVFCLLHSIYILDGLIFEDNYVTTFEAQKEGFGYMSAMGYSVYPFIAGSIIKYIVDFGVELAAWKLAIISLVFFFGFTLYRSSNSQKDAFRKNPYGPASSHLETIPTTQGKKLLCSSYWGVVRHPNYLGDILMQLCLGAFVLCAPPVIFTFLDVLLLLHRSKRDNERCKKTYGSAWDRYCHKVRYVLIPRVY